MAKTLILKEIGYLDEKFVNGCEDVDLYLRAEQMGYKVSRVDIIYHHDCESSEGRFDKINDNIKLFNKKWRGVCQIPEPVKADE